MASGRGNEKYVPQRQICHVYAGGGNIRIDLDNEFGCGVPLVDILLNGAQESWGKG
jgi:hypothetical protein